jgi:WD40 repeat protein
MNDHPILTDAALDAMLARRAGPGAPAALAESIVGAVETMPDARRRWWTVIGPPAAWAPAFRMAWIVAVAALLLAATASALYIGSQLLRRSDVTVVAPSVVLTLAQPGETSAVAWSPDGSYLATGSNTSEWSDVAEWTRANARVWDAATGDEVLSFEQLDAWVERIAYSPDGTRLAVTGLRPAVHDAATGEALPVVLPDRFLAFSPDGRRMVVGGAWGYAAVVDSTSGDELLSPAGCPGAYSWVSAAAWSPDGTRFATTCRFYVRVWDAPTGVKVLSLGDYGSSSWEDVEWSPDGTRIAAVGEDGSITIWDAAGVELASFAGGANALSWSPDGTRLVTAGDDGTAMIWDAASGVALGTLTGHTGPVTDVAWSPDGTRIATASEDGTAKVWQVEPLE